MARRTHRYRSVRAPKVGTTLVTLGLMLALLVGILVGGDELAGGLSGFFAPTQESEGVKQLPSQLPGDDSQADARLSAGQGEIATHTGAIVRRAIREAVIVARRPIARMGSALPLDEAATAPQSPASPAERDATTP